MAHNLPGSKTLRLFIGHKRLGKTWLMGCTADNRGRISRHLRCPAKDAWLAGAEIVDLPPEPRRTECHGRTEKKGHRWNVELLRVPIQWK